MAARSGSDFLKIPEVATRLGVSRTTVYRLIQAGRLKTVPWGAGDKRPHQRITQAELDRYLHSLSRGQRRGR